MCLFWPRSFAWNVLWIVFAVRPVDEGGSVALRPGGLTPEGYLGFVKRENLEQCANTEEGAEPVGLEVQEVKQVEKKNVCHVDFHALVFAVGGAGACAARAC